MKYHKIYNVPMETCTAEQKIAYNLAFANGDIFKKKYHAMPMQFQKSTIVQEAVNFCIKCWKNSRNFTEKYDIDCIFCALNAGMEKYIENNCPIYSSYESIGKAFPALYLDK